MFFLASSRDIGEYTPMGYIHRAFLSLSLVSISAATALARPVSYADGWMLMSTNDRMELSQAVSYSPTAKDAFGLRNDVMRDDGAVLTTATYNRLLSRWNLPDSQANLFLLTGLGASAKDGDARAAGTLGMEVDWESRRYYAAYEMRAVASSIIRQDFEQRARLGIAPYRGGYDDLHTWLMVEVAHQPSEAHPVIVTPFVRLFTTQGLGEMGISNRGDLLLNLTLQF